jgi:2-oxoglutarate ferredoxin oxidoreductase subunit gamma
VSGDRLREEIVAAGFGGQGIMLLGKLIASAGMLEGREVTYIPSYGAEVRGGTAHCMVIVSDREIASPLVSAPDSALVMNHPSLTKFEPRLRPGGLLVVNVSLMLGPPARTDVEIVPIAATETADELGAIQVANMVMLGAYLARRPIVKPETIVEVLRRVLPKRRHHLIGINEQALVRGAHLAQPDAASATRPPRAASGGRNP